MASREQIIETLKTQRRRFTHEEIAPSLKGWTRVMQYHFPDLNLELALPVTDGVPGGDRGGQGGGRAERHEGLHPEAGQGEGLDARPDEAAEIGRCLRYGSWSPLQSLSELTRSMSGEAPARRGKTGTSVCVAFKISSETIFPRETPRSRERSLALASASGSRFSVVLMFQQHRITHHMSSIKCAGQS